MKKPKSVVLSRHFRDNVTLVADMCEKCYQCQTDVKIVSVNLSFLKQIKKQQKRKTLTPLYKFSDCLLNFNFFLGFNIDSFNISVDNIVAILRHLYENSLIDFFKFDRNFLKKLEFYFNQKEESKYFTQNEFYKKHFKPQQLSQTQLPQITTQFTPPKSPHNLIEETLYDNPWALLVATIFLNKTSCKLARPCLEEFLQDLPTPAVVLKKHPASLEKYFVKIGLIRRRALNVWRMSYDYLHKDWKKVGELYGVGKYGEDAFRMFVMGDFSVEPRDRFLKIYKAWYENVLLKQN